jgi:hypothetical protein
MFVQISNKCKYQLWALYLALSLLIFIQINFLDDMTSNNSSNTCFICEQVVTNEDKIVPGEHARQNIIRCSKERRDDKHKYLSDDCYIVVHRLCRNEYTKPSNVKRAKLSFETPKEEIDVSPKRLRSSGNFDFDNFCIFCCDAVKKIPKKGKANVKRSVRVILDDSSKENIEKQAISRKDKWGRQVFSRIYTVKLKDVRPKYHYGCWKSFMRESSNSVGRPQDNDLCKAMEVIYSYLEQNDDCQFTITELCDLVEDYKISIRTMKHKLKEHYGDDIYITDTQSKVPVVCFRNSSDRIIHEHWYEARKTDIQEEEERIMAKAGEIARRSIEDFVFDNKTYNNPRCFMNDISDHIPKQLTVFLDALTSKKKITSKPKSLINKCLVLAHCLISLVKPNSFLSPVLLSVAAYIHQKVGSKSLITLLSNLGFCATYHDLKVFEASIITAPKEFIKDGTFVQFSFDNCDVNVNTIDGHGTFHNMSGIMCVTPANAIVTPNERIIKTERIPQSCLVQKKGIVTALDYQPKHSSGLNCFQFEDINELFSRAKCNDLPTTFDVCWLLAKSRKFPEIPGWQGMLERLTNSEYSDVTRVLQLPFIMSPPTDDETIYTSLTMAINEADKINLKTVFVTFDLPLFMKAVNIVLSAPTDSSLKRIVVRLGGFHLIMSFLGTFGHIMADSGLKELLSLVYAENSVVNILNGHAYSRAIRAHILASTALGQLILKQVNLSQEEEDAVKDLLEDLADFPPTKKAVDDDLIVHKVTEKFNQELNRLEEKGPTAKLWIQYLKMVTLVKRYIEAERTGNWELHLYVVKMMLPYFISSGHLHYSKACYIYLQLMSNLPQKMDPVDYERFANGYFTVKRTNKFCSGTWTDMVIEQTANREFKALGGIVRRGFTDEVLNAYVVTKPAFSDIVETLEEFCGINFFSSEQHNDARDCRIRRDEADIEKMYNWLETHDPFSSITSVVVSIGSGLSGNESINCHLSKELGSKRLDLFAGHKFKDIKLKRCDNVRPLSAVNSTVKVYDKAVNIDPLILYQRMLFRKDEDLSDYFKFELAPFPLSLFTNTGMRKNVKSSLYSEFECIPEQEVQEKLNNVTTHIIDGGHLLHSVRWGSDIANHTYQDICNTYLSYIQNNFENPVIVFDGYNDSDSIKTCEQMRRNKISSPDIKINEGSNVCTNQERFLANTTNKQQLISMLTKTLCDAQIEVKQSTGDADRLIVISALERSNSAIITQDTDILVLLTALAPAEQEYLLVKPKLGRTPQKVFSSNYLQQQHHDVKSYILFVHAFSGCDTTSAVYGKGKKQILKLIENERELSNWVKIFYKLDATHNEIKIAGESIFLSLYGSKAGQDTLDSLRFKLFQKSLKKSVIKLESLPPTSDSAALHAFRTYYQVQLWSGNKLKPEEWGWTRTNDILLPLKTNLEPAPEHILKLVSCCCKGECSTAKCSCFKSGIKCSSVCKYCEGAICTNSSEETKKVNEEDLEEENDIDTPDFED